jgi:hypothetical protein
MAVRDKAEQGRIPLCDKYFVKIENGSAQERKSMLLKRKQMRILVFLQLLYTFKNYHVYCIYPYIKHKRCIRSNQCIAVIFHIFSLKMHTVYCVQLHLT